MGGDQKRDFIYVTDVVDAFKKALFSECSGYVYNVGSGKPQSINTLIKLLGNPEKVHILKRPGEPGITHAAIYRIQQDLGWTPKVSFSEGVHEMLKNIDYWRDAPVWTPELIAEETKQWFECLGGSNEGSQLSETTV